MLHSAYNLTWTVHVFPEHTALGVHSLPEMKKHVHTGCVIAQPAAVKCTM